MIWPTTGDYYLSLLTYIKSSNFVSTQNRVLYGYPWAIRKVSAENYIVQDIILMGQSILRSRERFFP